MSPRVIDGLQFTAEPFFNDAPRILSKRSTLSSASCEYDSRRPDVEYWQEINYPATDIRKTRITGMANRHKAVRLASLHQPPGDPNGIGACHLTGYLRYGIRRRRGSYHVGAVLLALPQESEE